MSEPMECGHVSGAYQQACLDCLDDRYQEDDIDPLLAEVKSLKLQVHEARDVLAHLAANLRAAGGVFVGPAEMADALLSKWAEQGMEAMGFHVSNDSGKPPKS